jgi:hypothetical protein
MKQMSSLAEWKRSVDSSEGVMRVDLRSDVPFIDSKGQCLLTVLQDETSKYWKLLSGKKRSSVSPSSQWTWTQSGPVWKGLDVKTARQFSQVFNAHIGLPLLECSRGGDLALSTHRSTTGGLSPAQYLKEMLAGKGGVSFYLRPFPSELPIAQVPRVLAALAARFKGQEWYPLSLRPSATNPEHMSLIWAKNLGDADLSAGSDTSAEEQIIEAGFITLAEARALRSSKRRSATNLPRGVEELMNRCHPLKSQLDVQRLLTQLRKVYGKGRFTVKGAHPDASASKLTLEWMDNKKDQRFLGGELTLEEAELICQSEPQKAGSAKNPKTKWGCLAQRDLDLPQSAKGLMSRQA